MKRTRGRSTRLLAAAVLAVALAVTAPAPAADNAPNPEGPKGCPLFVGQPEGEGQKAPHGSLKTVIPGGPPLPGAIVPGVYMCDNGSWRLVAPWIDGSTPIYMEGSPTVTADTARVAVTEGTTAGNAGSYAWTDDDPVTLSASLGTVIDNGDGTWSWSYPATDGPAQTQTVVVSATAGAKQGGTSFDLVVDNAAPTVTSVTPDRTLTLVGRAIRFTGAATDASTEDTAAGLTWAFDGAQAAGNSIARSFAECGVFGVTATATDKDRATSPAVTSTSVTVLEARVASPLAEGSYNVVKAGRVVPVKLAIGCHGASATALEPSIHVLGGDVDPATDAGDAAQIVPTADASGADTSGVMRWSADHFHYNLRVPTAPPGQLFTVRIRPFGGSDAAVYAVLRIR